MAEEAGFEVEVVLAEPRVQRCCRLTVPAGTTAAAAAGLSGLLDRIDENLRPQLGLAVHGREVEPGRILEQGDRVEILRPLLHDPRARRRELARKGKVMGARRGGR